MKKLMSVIYGRILTAMSIIYALLMFKEDLTLYYRYNIVIKANNDNLITNIILYS